MRTMMPATNLQHKSIRWFSSSSNDELPYHIVVGMPALSPTMASGIISKWNVAEGDAFSAGDSLAVIETDKASMDLEAQDDGIVAKLLVGAGGGVELEVGSAIMVTVEEVEHVGAFAKFVPSGAASSTSHDVASSVPPPAATTAAPPSAPTKDLPYHIVVGMPALSPTMDAGTISKWNVAEGDSFSAGDSLAVIETDKASMDFEAQDDGVVAKLLVDAGAGETVTVGMPIMVTVEDVGDVPAFKDFVVGEESSNAASESKSVMEKPAAVVTTTPTPVASIATSTIPTAPSPAPPALTAAAVVSASAAPSGAISLGTTSSWGRLAAEKSPLAKALAKSQQQYIDNYGSTGHIPI